MKTIILIFSLFDSLICLAQAPNWVVFNHTNAPFVSDSITWVEVDTNNVKWVGTTNGLYSFYNNAWTTYNTSNSTLPNNRIGQFKIAYDNSIYFLNHNNGFIKYKNNVFTHYNKANTPSMRTDSLVGLTIDSNEVYFWSNYDGIVRFNGLTNTIFNIDTTNSYLKNIGTLQYHNNHTLYGMGIFNETIQLPQNRKDRMNVAVFIISTTPTLSINYCYEPITLSGGGNSCLYYEVLVDKLQNRDTYRRINSFGDTKKRLVDKNNSLISDINFNQPHYVQVLHATNGDYRLYQWNSVHDINTPFGVFNAGNSIIPDFKINRFDTDKYNNLWLATPKGLVGFNNTGLITGVNELNQNEFNVFPNPTTQFLNIQMPQPIQKIKLFNPLGLEFKVKIVNETLDLSELDTGFYFIEVETTNNVVIKRRF